MSQSSPAKAAVVKVSFRVRRETADAFNALASQRAHGLRGLFLGWLAAQTGYEDVAQRDLGRPDGRRRQPLLPARQESATGP